jgi:hypothetical protein
MHPIPPDRSPPEHANGLQQPSAQSEASPATAPSSDTAADYEDRTDQQQGADDQARRQRIRLYNDLLRTLGSGGRVMVSVGLSALGPQQLSAVRWAVARFDAFTSDNDPYGEHDCASQEVGSLSILWKIDYYDFDLAGCSPDPSDPSRTIRVLTLMLAEEY